MYILYRIYVIKRGVIPVTPVTRSLKRKCLFLSFHYLFFPILTDFFQCITTNFVSTAIVYPHLLKPQLIQQHPHLGSTELRLQLHIDYAKHIGHAVHLVSLAGMWDAGIVLHLSVEIGDAQQSAVMVIAQEN